MDVYEIVARLLNAMSPMAMAGLHICVITILAGTIIYFLGAKVWINSGSFRWLGIFYLENRKQRVHFAAAWIKFCLIIYYLCMFKKMETIHYLVFITIGLVSVISFRGISRTISNFIGFVVELGGIIAVNSICGYIKDMVAGMTFVALYILCAFFIACFALYIFLCELQDISGERRVELIRNETKGTNTVQ